MTASTFHLRGASAHLASYTSAACGNSSFTAHFRPFRRVSNDEQQIEFFDDLLDVNVQIDGGGWYKSLKGALQGAKLEQKWNEDLKAYTEKYPEEAEEFKQLISCELPKDWDATLPRFTPDDKVPPRSHAQTRICMRTHATCHLGWPQTCAAGLDTRHGLRSLSGGSSNGVHFGWESSCVCSHGWAWGPS